MQDVLLVENAERAEALLHPIRIDVLRQLADPQSCPGIARALGETTQKIYYHVKVLEKAGLVEKVDERRVRGIMEGLYRAKATSYWLSHALVGRVGGRARARDRLSLGFLLTLAEQIQSDVARLADATATRGETSSLGLSAVIELDPERKAAFLGELQEMFQALAEKYGRRPGDPSRPTRSKPNGPESFRLSLACYPRLGGSEREEDGEEEGQELDKS